MAEKIATRDSYGRALKELGAEFPNMVVLDADLSGSTKSGEFKKAFPERFFNAGIAEADLMGMATGLALSGKIAFASTFAMFAVGRAYEIVRNSIAYTGANVKICATHAGLSVGEDGASHQCLEDISLMRGLPGMTVLDPADDVSARKLLRLAAEMQGPVYIRLGRAAVPVVYPEDADIRIGKAVWLREGSDITIISSGCVLDQALAAADALAEDGISAGVLDMHTVKPFDEEAVLKAARSSECIVTVEDHFVTGGIGSAVAETLVKHGIGCRVKTLGAQDRFGQSGKPAELFREYGIDAAGIADAASALVTTVKLHAAP